MTKLVENQDIAETARTILGDAVAGVIEGAFRRMEFAEDEIAAAKRRFPIHAERVDKAFLLLCPSGVLMSAAETVYRLHCRELLERVVVGDDTREATTAELVATLSELSLRAPLDRSATLLYWEAFGTLFPSEAERLRAGIGPVAADSYDKQRAKELEVGLERKLRVPTRVMAQGAGYSKVA